MSEDNEADGMMFCASCGIAGGDDIKLKKCTACHLVKYCSVKCQKDHRPQHKRECKKRVAELRDEILFKQPESSYLGDCPICCLPLSIDHSKSSFYSCCSKHICNGCDHANILREMEGKLQQKCPFCRKTLPDTEEEGNEQLMKRVEANDPVAMRFIGTVRCNEGDYKSAFEYWTKAAALGDVTAHFQLSISYRVGNGVEKDKKKQLHHLKEAAIGGHPDARYNLAIHEWNNGNTKRAVKHWIIATKLGHDGSIEMLINEGFRSGAIGKEDLASALQAHKAAKDATKSLQRNEAEEFQSNSL